MQWLPRSTSFLKALGLGGWRSGAVLRASCVGCARVAGSYATPQLRFKAVRRLARCEAEDASLGGSLASPRPPRRALAGIPHAQVHATTGIESESEVTTTKSGSGYGIPALVIQFAAIRERMHATQDTPHTCT